MAEAFSPVERAVQNVYRQMFYFGVTVGLLVFIVGVVSTHLAFWLTLMLMGVMMAWAAWQRRKVLKDGR